jgi:hypothetical protein
MRTAVKLLVAAAIVNATWHVMSAYITHYRFQDAVAQAVQFESDLSDDQVRQRVVDLMSDFDVPSSTDGFTLRRDDSHTVLQGSYSRQLDLLPGFSRRWPFTWRVETYTLKTARGLRR